MWRWLRRLFAPTSAPEGRRASDPGSRIGFTSDRILFHGSGGTERTLRWEDLGGIDIVTTDTGPFEVDLHWVLTGRDGKYALSVPMGAVGEQDLLRELQRRLPDLDNEAVILAMGSTVNATFKVWRQRPIPAAPKPA
jgi:hypothetical protein